MDECWLSRKFLTVSNLINVVVFGDSPRDGFAVSNILILNPSADDSFTDVISDVIDVSFLL